MSFILPPIENNQKVYAIEEEGKKETRDFDLSSRGDLEESECNVSEDSNNNRVNKLPQIEMQIINHSFIRTVPVNST